MKTNIFFIAICAALCALISCQSTGKVKEQEFIVDAKSPQIQIGEFELQLEPMLSFGKLKKTLVTVLYAPVEDAVVLRYKHEFFTYQQCWSRNGRYAFIEALQKYNDDYEARTLDIKSRKSKKKYGTVKGYLIWQQFSFTVRARAKMNMELGYTFKDRAPYFIVNQMQAEFIDEQSRDNNRTSIVIPFYFTRAQAAELAALFDPEFIDGLNMSNSKTFIDNDIDEYYE